MSIPFVPASGGHSLWSTINEDGFILDLSLYKDIVAEPSKNIVTVKGGVLMKDFQVALNKVGQFTSKLSQYSHIPDVILTLP